MSSELSSGTDLPGETGTGTGPDITPVPEHAGRDIGITRAELYNQLYGDHADTSNTAHGETTGDSSDGNGQDRVGTGADDADGGDGDGDGGDDQPAAPGTGLENQDTGTSQPGTGAGTAEGTGTSDDGGNREGTGGGNSDTFGSSPEPAEPGAEENATGTPVRPGMPDGGETTGPGASARDSGRDSSPGQAGDGTTPPEGNQADSQGGTDTGGPSRNADRAAGGQDTARAQHPDHGSKDAAKAPPTGTETAEPAARRTGGAEGETTQAPPADAPQPKQKDQPDEQNPAPDASPDQPGGTDEQRWAALEQRMQAAMEQRMQAALDDMKAGYDGKLDAIEAKHKAEIDSIKAQYDDDKTQLRQEISDLKDKLATGQPEQQPAPDRSPDRGERPPLSGTPDVAEPGERRNVLGVGTDAGAEADLADRNEAKERRIGGPDRQPQSVSRRPGFSAESVEAGKAAMGIAGTLGLLPSGLPLVLGGDSALRAFKEMPPEDQYAAISADFRGR